MKKLLVFMLVFALVSAPCFAQDTSVKQKGPFQEGAFYGPLPVNVNFNDRYGYPQSYGYSVEKLYLYKHKISVVDWVNKKKGEFIKSALNEAKAYAIKNKCLYYAIDNLHFQIISDKNSVSIYSDANVIAW